MLQSIYQLPKANKNQSAAVVASQGLLIVWDDDVGNLIARASNIERELMELVWEADGTEIKSDRSNVKKGPEVVVLAVDEESGEEIPEQRPVHLLNSIYVSIVLFIIIAMLGAGMRQLAFETKADGNYLRLALVLLLPVNIFFTLVSHIQQIYK